MTNFARKSTITRDFITLSGMYLMSKAPNSVAHKVIHLARSGLCSIVYRGKVVTTSMVWLLKYGMSFQANVMKV